MAASSKLPSWLAEGISSIRWPLDEKYHPPLHFQSIETMKKIRGETCTSGPECPCFTESYSFQNFVAHLPESFERILPQEDGDKRYFGLVSIALILLGNGYTDEAHSILAPLSYPQELSFGYRDGSYSRASEEARSYASYVHSLVHRREGKNVGEFGMVGFDNASYWSSIVFRSPGVESLPSLNLRQGIERLARQSKYSDSLTVQGWINQNRLREPMEDPFFEARILHELCASVVDGNDAVLKDFAEQASELEVRILLAHTLQRAGFDAIPSEVTKRYFELANDERGHPRVTGEP